MWKCVECGIEWDMYSEAKHCCVDMEDDAIYGEPDEPIFIEQ